MYKKILLAVSLAVILPMSAWAKTTVPMQVVLAGQQHGQNVGTVTFEDSKYGLLIIPHLKDLPPGLHGFHVHVNASCADDGNAAGGHLDPANTGKHLGPYANGHLGDLPVLYVDQQGQANTPSLAPRLSVNQIKGHALMIHLHGDNYSDEPEKLGGGGPRLACGVIK